MTAIIGKKTGSPRGVRIDGALPQVCTVDSKQVVDIISEVEEHFAYRCAVGPVIDAFLTEIKRRLER